MKVLKSCIGVFFSLTCVIRVPKITKTIILVQFDKFAPRKTKSLKNGNIDFLDPNFGSEFNMQFQMCVYREKKTALPGLSGSPGQFFLLQKVHFQTDSAMS